MKNFEKNFPEIEQAISYIEGQTGDEEVRNKITAEINKQINKAYDNGFEDGSDTDSLLHHSLD